MQLNLFKQTLETQSGDGGRSWTHALLGLGLSLCVAVGAQAELLVKDAWVRATAGPQRTSAAFMQLQSSEAAHLVGVKAAVAAHAEIHEMRHEGDVMKMKAIDQLELPPGKAVALTPGGYHLMLMGLKDGLAVGQEITLELQIQPENGGSVRTKQVRAQVRALAAPMHGGAHGVSHGATHRTGHAAQGEAEKHKH